MAQIVVEIQVSLFDIVQYKGTKDGMSKMW